MPPPSLSPYPFLRALIPIAAGIALFRTGVTEPWFALAAAATGIAVYAVLKNIKSIPRQRRLNFGYAPSLFLILLACGWWTACVHAPKRLPKVFLNKPLELYLKVNSVAQSHRTTIVKGTFDAGNEHGINLLLTIKGNLYNIEIGDILRCHTTIEPIRNSTIPEAFDYAEYMSRQGFLYRTHITHADFIKAGYEPSLMATADKLKKILIKNIRQLRLSPEASNFAIALFSGDRSFIDDETRDLFRDAGLAHILAVSGLHIGIVATIVTLLLAPLNFGKLRSLKWLLSLLAIWGYAFFTGLAPSSCRAAIMASFMLTAFLIRRNNSVWNAFFAAAVFILLFDPYSLVDAGFQLSFLSVGGILLFAPKLTFGRKPVWRYLSATVAVPVSAQLGTLALTIYYFHSVPTAFLFGNLIVVPLLPLFVAGVLLSLLISATGIILLPLSSAIDFLYALFQTVTEMGASLSGNGTLQIWTSNAAVVFYYIFLILLGITLYSRKYIMPACATASVCLAGLIIEILIQTDIRKEQGLFLSDSYDTTNAVCYGNRRAYIINSQNDTAAITEFIDRNRRFFLRQGICTIYKISKSCSTATAGFSHPLFSAGGHTFVFVRGNSKYMSGKQRMRVDYLILTKYFYGNVARLGAAFSPDTILLTNEIYASRRMELAKECANLNIPVKDLSKEQFHIRF